MTSVVQKTPRTGARRLDQRTSFGKDILSKMLQLEKQNKVSTAIGYISVL